MYKFIFICLHTILIIKNKFKQDCCLFLNFGETTLYDWKEIWIICQIYQNCINVYYNFNKKITINFMYLDAVGCVPLVFVHAQPLQQPSPLALTWTVWSHTPCAARDRWWCRTRGRSRRSFAGRHAGGWGCRWRFEKLWRRGPGCWCWCRWRDDWPGCWNQYPCSCLVSDHRMVLCSLFYGGCGRFMSCKGERVCTHSPISRQIFYWNVVT